MSPLLDYRSGVISGQKARVTFPGSVTMDEAQEGLFTGTEKPSIHILRLNRVGASAIAPGPSQRYVLARPHAVIRRRVPRLF